MGRIDRRVDNDLDVVVGLPAYNEAVGIGSTVLCAQNFADQVIVVDDGSDDRTAEIASAAGATVIRHETNKGKGGAVKTLLDAAEDRHSGVVVLLDADGQHFPSDIPAVVEPVLDRRADIVIGSRYLRPGASDETPSYRRFGQKVLDVLTVGGSNLELTDTQSGFRALSPQAMDEIQLTTDGIGVETEMIRSSLKKDLVIIEVPINVRYEGIEGQTYNPVRHGLTIVNFLLRRLRDRHPLLSFTLPGLFLIFAGTLYGFDGLLIYRATGEFYPAKVLIAAFLIVMGSLGALTGTVLNSLSNTLTGLDREL